MAFPIGLVYPRFRAAYGEPNAMIGSPVLTVRDIARLLKVDEKTIYRLVKKKVLPGFKVAGTWRFKQEDIDEWIEKQKAATP